MIPRAGRVAVRQTAQKPPQPQYQAYSFPGPSQGWVSDQNLAMSQPGAAYMLQNIFPIATGGILRRGCIRQADLVDAEVLTLLSGTVSITAASKAVVGAGTDFTNELTPGDTIKIDGQNYTIDTITDDENLTMVEDAEATASGEDAYLVTLLADPGLKTLFSYESGSTARLFAGTDGGIYDVTTKDDPQFSYLITEGRFSTAQYTSTDGTRYVRGVNGVDVPWLYDGVDFSTTPALTFPADPDVPSPEDMVFTWVYRNRFFFIEKDSLDVWYLPVGNIGGQLAQLGLGGVFRLGGKLVFGGQWSIESGSGLNSYCVFATDKGEVAVFSGSDPGDANDWLMIGVYVVGRPRGDNAFAYRGGDLLIATDVGLIVLSSALQKDAVTVALSALSAPIENEWRRAAQRRFGNWAVEVWSAGQMIAISLPTGEQETPTWLVANARTNRWAEFTGWDATCMEVFGDRLFYGSPDGKVFEAMAGGHDDGLPYTGLYVPVFDQCGVVGLKTVHMARAVIRSSPKTIEKLHVQEDFTVNIPTPPDASPTQALNQWGTGVWGQAIWGGNDEKVVQDVWRNVFGQGEAVSISHQVTSAGAAPLDSEFIRTDILFTPGEMQS